MAAEQWQLGKCVAAAFVLTGVPEDVRDRAGFGAPDARDFLATALGAAVVLPALII